MKRNIILIASICAIAALTVGIIAAGAKSTGAPVAENLEITTYRGVSVNGQLKATDPDGDIMNFEITTEPNKGTITLGENGSFVYTPSEGKRGSDYFGYKAVDKDGNESSEATVIIRIRKQKTAVTYSDLNGNGAQYAAIVMAENGVFTGENLGGEYVFSPNRAVTRGEFLTMCMKVANVDVLTGVITTGFEDDYAIPSYQKPYVSTALLTGVINGYSNGYRTAIFNGDNNINYSEAAVMLNKVMQLSDVKSDNYLGIAPTWAVQACANLSACDISDCSYDGYEAVLTRADCAEMLINAMQVLSNR